MQNTIFIVYYIPDKFLYHFDELSSHTTVVLAQPQLQIVYFPLKCRSSKYVVSCPQQALHVSLN